MAVTATAPPVLDEAWYRQCFAESIVDITKGLARLATVVEQMQRLGYLPPEFQQMSQDIRPHVVTALKSFQRAGYPDKPLTEIKFS